jgi:hypothetical protein
VLEPGNTVFTHHRPGLSAVGKEPKSAFDMLRQAPTRDPKRRKMAEQQAVKVCCVDIGFSLAERRCVMGF